MIQFWGMIDLIWDNKKKRIRFNWGGNIGKKILDVRKIFFSFSNLTCFENDKILEKLIFSIFSATGRPRLGY